MFCRRLCSLPIRRQPSGRCRVSGLLAAASVILLAAPHFSIAAETAITTKPPGAPATAIPATLPVPTVIESGAAEMVSTEKETTFTFRNGVTVTATNMKLTCDHLEVVARRSGDPSAT